MSNETGDKIQEEIKALTHELLDAVRSRDEATLDRILSDDFVIAGWQPEGRLADKKFYIADAMTPVEIESGSYRYDAWKFRIHGNVIIVNCTLDIHAIVNGHPWAVKCLSRTSGSTSKSSGASCPHIPALSLEDSAEFRVQALACSWTGRVKSKLKLEL